MRRRNRRTASQQGQQQQQQRQRRRQEQRQAARPPAAPGVPRLLEGGLREADGHAAAPAAARCDRHLPVVHQHAPRHRRVGLDRANVALVRARAHVLYRELVAGHLQRRGGGGRPGRSSPSAPWLWPPKAVWLAPALPEGMVLRGGCCPGARTSRCAPAVDLLSAAGVGSRAACTPPPLSAIQCRASCGMRVSDESPVTGPAVPVLCGFWLEVITGCSSPCAWLTAAPLGWAAKA